MGTAVMAMIMWMRTEMAFVIPTTILMRITMGYVIITPMATVIMARHRVREEDMVAETAEEDGIIADYINEEAYAQ